MSHEARAVADANHARYRPAGKEGFYESFFLRANHPARPLAFWIRYTLFRPQGRPADAIGELWAVFFDGEGAEHVAVKRELPIAACAFDRGAFSVAVGEAALGPGRLRGSAASSGRAITWDLSFEGTEPPLFLLPLGMYEARLPRAKGLVALPMALFAGSLVVDGQPVDVGGWIGSQNHNWGTRHTDEYAWGQVAGFDSHPGAFLEVATARLKIGPLWTPRMTIAVLRHGGREHRLNRIGQSLAAQGIRRGFDWTFASENEDVRIEGTVAAPRQAFVGLRYYNPPGGEKHCLNTKIARCALSVLDKRTGSTERLVTGHRAAFEILTDDRDHGIAIQA